MPFSGMMDFDTQNMGIFGPSGNPVTLVDDRERAIETARKVVKGDVEAGKRWADSQSGHRTEMYSLYRAKQGQKIAGAGESETRPGRSRIDSSDVMDVIEWMLPSLMKAFAGGQDSIDVLPQGEEDVEKADKNKKLLNWQFMNRCNGFLVLYELIKASLVYGTAYAKVTWREDFVRRDFHIPEVIEPEMMALMHDDSIEEISVGEITHTSAGFYAGMFDPFMDGAGMLMGNSLQEGLGLGGGETVYRDVEGERRIVTYSGPMLDVIPPEEILLDPEARSIDDAMFVIHRVKRTVSYLREREREGIYSNIDEVVEKASSTDDELRLTEESARFAISGDSTAFASVDEGEQVARKKVEVYEWWGQLDLDGEGVSEPYLVVMAGDTVIRMERNPYAHGLPPFIAMSPIKDMFRFHGIGIAELVGEFQKVKTALIRQMLDNLSFQNNQMWEVDENAGVDIEALINPRPGGIVFTNMLNRGFKQIAPAPLGTAPLQMMEFVQGQLELRSGVTRYNQGLDAKSLNHTATGISAIMNASAQRIELIARVMSFSIKKMYQMMLELNQQFIDQALVVRIFNQPLEISPDDLAGNFDVNIDIGGATGKDAEQIEQMMSILQYSPNLLRLGVMTPQNIYECVKRVMGIWGWKDYETYLSDPQEAEVLRAIMGQIEQLGAAIQQGQLPPLEAVVGVLQEVYNTLAHITGAGMERQPGMEGLTDGGGTPGGPAITGILDPNQRAAPGLGALARQIGYGGAG